MSMEKTDFAKKLRRESTPAENLLWNHLRDRQFHGFKFKRQAPIGIYIVDLVCFAEKLIIELDGGHHAEERERIKDQGRTDWLENEGFQIIRFWNDEVINNTEGVGMEIYRILKAPSPQPSPTVWGEGARRAEFSKKRNLFFFCKEVHYFTKLLTVFSHEFIL